METKSCRDHVIPISYGSTEVIETGRWSSQKPQPLVMIPPCQEACPVGTDISLFLHFVEKGMYAEALSTILMENPFPAVCGRVCHHPCEAGCNRAQYDESVSIQMLERFVSSVASENICIQPVPVDHPRKIAVIGSGPAGLSCAYFLALLGHHPTVYEAQAEPGGVMRWGIPRFRLPKAVLKREIRRILRFPIELRTHCRVGKDIAFEELERSDALFLSPGAQHDALLEIEGENLEGVWNSTEFLGRINTKQQISLGGKTIVVGGGNTAMDAARSALRLGSRVTIAYRRTRDEMPAIRDEIAEAEEEGIEFKFLIQPLKVRRTQDRKLEITFQRMKLGAPDAGNRLRAVPVKNEFVTLEADSVIRAVGEAVDHSWIPEKLIKNGLIEPESSAGIFAGGDAVAQPRTIATAIAAAKRAAISMDLFFGGFRDRDSLAKLGLGNKGSLSIQAYIQAREKGIWPEPKPVVSSRQIHKLYFPNSRRIKTRKLAHEKRLMTFAEVNRGADAGKASISASRCYSCGRCNACCNCYYFCPEGAVSIDPQNRTRTVDLMHCKGCGTCAKACPRCAIEMRDLL
jgi:NADPH-dependent glutamate synthase beta subunit-like oxidoreductase